MRRNTILMMLVIIMTIILALPLTAQEDDDWFVYLLDTVDYHLLRVNENGSTEEYVLPLPENSFFTDIGFGADGRFASYCTAVKENPFAANPVYTANVVDVVGGTVLRTIELGGVYNCIANGFSADSTLLGIGVINRFPGDPNADTSLPIWNLYVYNIISGELVASLDSDNPIASEVTLFGGENEPIIPSLIEVSETEVVFMAYPGAGMGGVPELNVYRWDVTTGTVEEIARRGVINGDYLDATGEIVIPAIDSSLPVLEPGGPMVASNVVSLTSGGETRTIYHSETQIITSTTFVNDGTGIAVTLLDPFNPDEMFQRSSLLVVDRDSNVVQDSRDFQGYVQPFAAPGGYLLMFDTPHELAAPDFTMEYHGADGTSRQLWNYTPGENGTFWQLVYVSR